jgi:predicted enzyme involved in methoxymalonyl-ACP biosynthesis
MALLVEQAKAKGASRLFGRYVPTARNAMVKELYSRLGFTLLRSGLEGELVWMLKLSEWQGPSCPISYRFSEGSSLKVSDQMIASR